MIKYFTRLSLLFLSLCPHYLCGASDIQSLIEVSEKIVKEILKIEMEMKVESKDKAEGAKLKAHTEILRRANKGGYLISKGLKDYPEFTYEQCEKLRILFFMFHEVFQGARLSLIQKNLKNLSTRVDQFYKEVMFSYADQ
ncbi:hypothetical protein ACFLY6_00425 [Candidatus Dependentiae bacterium]